MRILIVEDERALCDTLVKSLKQKGYEVDACYDGDSALDWLLTEKYDLLLLDLNLPGRDGMDLLKTLREQDRETRVLILSARSRISAEIASMILNTIATVFLFILTSPFLYSAVASHPHAGQQQLFPL